MIKTSVKILILLLLISGCDNVNPGNNEPGSKLQDENISGKGITESYAYKRALIDSQLSKQGRLLSSLEAKQNKSRSKNVELKKEVFQETEKYHSLLAELEELCFQYRHSRIK